MWIRFDGSTSWADSGIMNWAAGTNYNWYFSALPAQVFRYSWNTPAYGYVESNTGLSRDTWYHMAVVREGTGAGGVKFFQDGVLVGTSGGSNSGGNSADSTNYAAQSQGIRIGNYWTNFPIMNNTYLDEIRISNVARYTANFTTFGQDGGTIASPTPFTPDANTKLLIHGEAQSALSTAFKVDGTAQATQTLTEGYTYKFDTSDSTLSGHTLKFATAADAAGSTEYTTGVTEVGTPGSAGAYTQIVVPASAPTLYYYCSNHASMGGTANTPTEVSTTSMRYKVETKNQSGSKITRIHGTSLAWK